VSVTGDILRVNFEGTSSTGDVMMITRAIQHVAGTERVASLLAGDIRDDFEANFTLIDAQIADTVSFDLVRLFSVNPADGELNEVATAVISAGSGSAIDNALPNQDAISVAFPVSIPRHNGAWSIPGATEANQDSDIWSATLLANVGSFAVLYAGNVDLAGRTFTWGTWSRTTLTFYPHTGAVRVNTNVKSQRRRQAGVGV